MKIVDTHQHLWDLNKFGYAWTTGHPILGKNFLLPEYRAATAGLDIAQTVFLECDIDDKDRVGEAQFICALAENPDNKIGGVVAGARPDEPDFEEYLKTIAHPKLKGLRRILHVVPDDTMDSPGFIDNVAQLGRYNLSWDICVLARQLPLAIRLIKECSDVQFILDHCGNPDVINNEFSVWADYIDEVASFSNVVVKISGIVVNAKKNEWTAEDLRPYINHLTKTFGWERVMFGSDWPVCLQNSSLQKWADTLLFLTQDAGAANQQKLFQTNAERIYRL